MHCGTGRELASSGYAERRAECERAANLIGRPLGLCELGDLSVLSEPVLRRRARHVITECDRVREVERLLGRSNLTAVGAVMTDGHRSLAEDFKVSIPALDELVDRLVRLPGVYGARMTGGGFGGLRHRPLRTGLARPRSREPRPAAGLAGQPGRRGGGAGHALTAARAGGQSPDSAQAACDDATSCVERGLGPTAVDGCARQLHPGWPGRRPGRSPSGRRLH